MTGRPPAWAPSSGLKGVPLDASLAYLAARARAETPLAAYCAAALAVGLSPLHPDLRGAACEAALAGTAALRAAEGRGWASEWCAYWCAFAAHLKGAVPS